MRIRGARSHLESLEVEPRGLVDLALLPLDVGQVILRVGMRWAQLKERIPHA